MKKKTIFTVMLVCLLAFCLVFVGCDSGGGGGGSNTSNNNDDNNDNNDDNGDTGIYGTYDAQLIEYDDNGIRIKNHQGEVTVSSNSITGGSITIPDVTFGTMFDLIENYDGSKVGTWAYIYSGSTKIGLYQYQIFYHRIALGDLAPIEYSMFNGRFGFVGTPDYSDINEPNQYFNDIFERHITGQETYLDIGTLNLDTISGFIKYVKRGRRLHDF
jgi:hypothetical protein